MNKSWKLKAVCEMEFKNWINVEMESMIWSMIPVKKISCSENEKRQKKQKGKKGGRERPRREQRPGTHIIDNPYYSKCSFSNLKFLAFRS